MSAKTEKFKVGDEVKVIGLLPDYGSVRDTVLGQKFRILSISSKGYEIDSEYRYGASTNYYMDDDTIELAVVESKSLAKLSFEQSTYSEGDSVKLIAVLEEGVTNIHGWSPSFNHEMLDNLGKVGKVRFLVTETLSFKVDFGENSSNYYDLWSYPAFCLQKIEKPTQYDVKLNDTYTAKVTEDNISVGCQTFSMDKLKEMVEAAKKLGVEF